MQDKYIPHRRCISCRKSFPQDLLIRVVLTKYGLCVKSEEQLDGRSCYICRNDDCIKRAFDKNGFSRSFRRSFEKEELLALNDSIKLV